jgi:hypothetical protein
MLWLYWRICFGKARTPEAAAMIDLSAREWWLLAPIALAVFWMGIYPETFMRPIRGDVGRVLTRLERVAPAGDSQPTLGKGALQISPNGQVLMNGKPVKMDELNRYVEATGQVVPEVHVVEAAPEASR